MGLESEVLPLDLAHWDAFRKCVIDTFRRPNMDLDEAWPSEADQVDRFTYHHGGEFAGCYSVIPYEITRGLGALRAGGVAGVAIKPEFRGGGAGSAMMVESLRQMRQDGHQLAVLYAFRESYYRRFGYEVCGHRWRHKVNASRMPLLKQHLAGYEVSPNDLGKLAQCHRDFAHGLSGAMLRTPKQWEVRMGKNAPLIYAFGDPVEAYCWTSMEGSFWETLTFGENCWSTRRGYESMLNFMRNLAINRNEVVWEEPSSGPFLARFYDQGVDIESYRVAMYRVLNVEESLKRLVPQVNGSVRIRVFDPIFPENEGPWRIDYGPGSVVVTRCEGHDVQANIEQFSQAFLGDPSWLTLKQYQMAEFESDEALFEVSKLMPPRTVFCTEFF